MMRLSWVVLCATLWLAFACDKSQTSPSTAPRAEVDGGASARAVDAGGGFQPYGVRDGLLIPRWEPEPYEPKIRRSLLWRVERDGRVIYLMPSTRASLDLHGVKDFPDDVRQALEESSHFIREYGYAPFEFFLKAGKFQDGKSLRDMMDERHWEMLVEESEVPEGEPRDILAGNRPWMIFHGIVGRAHLQGPGGPVSKHFRTVIEENELEVDALEGPLEYVRELLLNIKVEQVNLMLERLSRERQLLAGIPDAYIHGNFNELESIALESVALCGYGPYCQKHIVARTRKWVPRLADFAKQGTTFSILPLPHFVGPASLMKEFQRRGYSVRRVEPKLSEEDDTGEQ